MDRIRRLDEERKFHDAQARERLTQIDEASEAHTAKTYLDHAPWIRPGLDLLEPLSGKTALDLGSGHGWAAVELARRGAKVLGTDLSWGYCNEARLRHIRLGFDTPFFQADGENLPLSDSSIDRIWGNAILHHLDTQSAIREVTRILAPGGMAVFCEPWGGNPLIAFARKWLPYPGKERTRDEAPWTNKDLGLWREAFPEHQIESFELFSALRRFGGTGANWPLISIVDRFLFRVVPALGKFARYRMICVRKKQG